MAKVIMGIGIPGSGKTTVLKPFAEKHSYIYISPDDIRAELTGDAADQSRQKEVWKEAYLRTAHALQRGETVVFDATFAKELERKEFIQFVRDNGAHEVHVAFADIPLDVAQERNRSRERTVPAHALVRMHAMLEKAPPVLADGFDGIVDIQDLERTI